MNDNIEVGYVFDYETVVNGLKAVDERLATQERILENMSRIDPYKGLAQSSALYNRQLADGTKIYQQITGDAVSYRAELTRLRDIEKQLIQQQTQFQNSIEYDDATKSLEAVRTRIAEVKTGLKGLNDSFTESERKAKDAGKSTNEFGNILRRVGEYAVIYFSVEKVLAFGKSILDITTNYQKYEAVLTNALGSQRLAQKGLIDIADIAVKTPFQINELTESYVKYVNRGLVPTKQELLKLGDLAATSGKTFDQLTEAILDSVTGENERLKAFGIKATQSGDTVTFSFRGMLKEVNRFDQEGIRKAIISFGDLSGVAGSMNVQMTTLGGFISNASDNYDQFKKNIGDGNSGALFDAVNLLGQFAGWLRKITTEPVTEQLIKEQVEFNNLSDAILLTNQGSEERNRLIQELTQKYPELLKFIDTETLRNQDLLSVMKFINGQYERRIELAGIDAAVQQQVEKTGQAYREQRESLVALTSAYRAYFEDTKAGFAQLTKAEKESQVTGAISQFRNSTTGQQNAIIQQLRDNAQKRAAENNGAVFSFNADERNKFFEPKKQIEALDQFRERQKAYNEEKVKTANLTSDQIEAQKKLADFAKDEAAKEAKRAETLGKNVISEKEYTSLLQRRSKLNGEDLEALNKSVAGKKQLKQIDDYLTYQQSKRLSEAEKHANDESKPIAYQLAKSKTQISDENRLARERETILRELEEAELKFQLTISKIRLEADNARLSELDKNSVEYLEKKRAYDYAQIEQERKTQVLLFSERNSQPVAVNRGDGKLVYEKQSLIQRQVNANRANGQTPAQAQANAFNTASSAFEKANDPATKATRELLGLKRDLVTYLTDKEFQDLTQKFLNEGTAILGEGLDKEIAVIGEKYRVLFDTYKSNTDLIGRLRVAKQTEIATKLYQSRQKEIADEKSQAESLLDLSPKQNGTRDVDFEQEKAKKKLDIQRDFYAKSLAELEKYLTSQEVLNGITDGTISKEKKAELDKQLELLRAQSAKANKDSENFAKSQSLFATRYTDIWEVAGDVFKGLGDKVNFFNDENNKQIREALTTTYDAVKSALSSFLDTEIQASRDRVAVYDKEVSDKENRLSEELDKQKQGLANSAVETKKDLENTKRLREEEVANQKKLQKEKAIIDSAEVASTTLVTTATLVKAMAKALDGFAGIPILGIVLGLAAIATLFSGFSAIKGKIKASEKLRYGKRLNGPSHENGGLDIINPQTGEVEYEGEGREWLMGAKPSEKHDELLGHINEDTFKDLPTVKQRKLLDRLGFNHSNVDNDLNRTLGTFRTVLNFRDSAYGSQHYDRMNQSLRDIANNTGRITDEGYIPVGNGKLARTKNGRIIGIHTISE